MRHFILFTCFAFISFTSLAQWEQRADPLFTKDHGIGFSLDGFGYVLTGGANGQVFTATKDFFKYDPTTDSWEKLADYPGPARGYGIGDTWNGKLYFGFGLDDNDVMLNDLWEWDPASNTFTQLPSCPCDPRVHPGLIADNGKVYVGAGGGDAGNLSDFWTYDITTQTWSQIADIPGKRHHPYQFSVDGEVYVGAGHLESWYKLDENTNSWIKLANLVARVAGSQFSYNGKGYALSGADVNHNIFSTGEFWEYDPTTDAWTELCPHPGTSRFGSTQFLIDNYIYLLGGYWRKNGNVSPETTMHRYDLDQTITFELDNTVTVSGNTLTASQAGAKYQWINCDKGNTAINGATGQSYTPSISGNFAVEITVSNGSCTYTETSGCQSLTFVGISEYTENNFSIYPNPAKEVLTLELTQISNKSFTITDGIGKVIRKGTISSHKQDIDVSNLAKGVYIIRIGEVNQKFINE